jgi:hypothetical protein
MGGSGTHCSGSLQLVAILVRFATFSRVNL